MAKGIHQPRLGTLLLPLALLFGGCASVPQESPRKDSWALSPPQQSATVQALQQRAGQNEGLSGFSIIRYGKPALNTRLALSDLAERSLDLQYYIWEGDESGRLLAERLLRAADRGVRVRVLLDDINTHGRDSVLAALDAHPGIKIRLFNPFSHRRLTGLDFVTDFARINHRMHNKLMLMDSSLAIVGGRNIGNHYFEVATDANFRDLDIAAAGPVVPEIARVFDHFWNGAWSVPIAALVDRPYSEEDLALARSRMLDAIASSDGVYGSDQDVAAVKMQRQGLIDQLIWAPGQMVWDDPARIVTEGGTSRVNETLYRWVDGLERELLVEAAYFIQRARGQAQLAELSERGVRVRVLTNSLASNDVIAAHAGYAATRPALLDSGVELYELRPYPEPTHKRLFSRKSRAALHTKAMVFDRRAFFIGSFNLDARSAEINTEAGLLVESPELTAQLIAYLDEGVSPQSSYRVSRDRQDNLVWRTEQGGQSIEFRSEPETEFWQRWLADLIRLLPLEDQL